MIIETVSKEGRNQLRLSLEGLTRSFSKRGISFVISAESEYVATITILVTGSLGTVQKNVTLVYNQLTTEWEAYSEGVVCKLLALSEISTLIKSKINTLSVLLKKI